MSPKTELLWGLWVHQKDRDLAPEHCGLLLSIGRVSPSIGFRSMSRNAGPPFTMARKRLDFRYYSCKPRKSSIATCPYPLSPRVVFCDDTRTRSRSRSPRVPLPAADPGVWRPLRTRHLVVNFDRQNVLIRRPPAVVPHYLHPPVLPPGTPMMPLPRSFLPPPRLLIS